MLLPFYSKIFVYAKYDIFRHRSALHAQHRQNQMLLEIAVFSALIVVVVFALCVLFCPYDYFATSQQYRYTGNGVTYYSFRKITHITILQNYIFTL